MDIRKVSILLTVFTLCISCDTTKYTEENFVPVKFNAEINVGEDKVMWKDGDCISLYNGKSAPINRGTRLIYSSLKGETKSATFEGFLRDSPVFYAAVPYANVETWASDGTPSLPLEISARQTAVEGRDGINVDENLFVSKSLEPKGKMSFYPAYPLVRVSFNETSPLVASMSISSVSGKMLCGRYDCRMDASECVSLSYVSGGESSVTFSSFDGECPLNEGSYYIGVAPGEYPEGDLVITYNYTNGKSSTLPLEVGTDLEAGVVYDCGIVQPTGESGGGTISDSPVIKIEDKYDIYLCIGQSNMAGRGYLFESDLNTVIKNVYLLDADGEPVPATHPFNQYSTIRKEMKMQQMHLGYSFSTIMTSGKSSRPVLLVCNARGGTSITEWTPGTYYYTEAVNRTLLAMRYGTLKGILWHQGCADSSKRVNQYPGLLQTMVEGLREDLRMPSLPVVVGELPYWRSTSEDFNVMLRNVPETISNLAVVSAEGCGMRADASDPHFSRDGLNILGRRYAEEMKKLINK